jgi:hypothetical protein
MLRHSGILLLLVGCSRDGGDRSAIPGGTGAPGDTAPPTFGPTDPALPDLVAATCAPDPANGLRAICTATLDSPGDIAVSLTSGEIAPVLRQTSSSATAQSLVVWGLTKDADWDWTISVVEHPASATSGVLHSGDVPSTIGPMTVAVTSTGAHGDEPIVFNYGCLGLQESLVAIDRDGNVRWYQELPGTQGEPLVPASVRGLNVTADQTVLAVLDRSGLAEFTIDGQMPLYLQQGVAFEQPVHHDVNRWNGYTYALFSEEVEVDGVEYVMDGFYVFDSAGAQVAEWHEKDHVTPAEGGFAGGLYWGDIYPGAVDWAHTNALAIEPDGHVTVSLRFQNALLHVDGDPQSPDFGALEWILVGDVPDSTLVSTIPVTSSTGIDDLGFAQQHDLAAVGDGVFTLWDNGVDPEAGSRAMKMTFAYGQMDIVQDWLPGAFCPGQGSATVLPNGDALVDCAPADTFIEVAPDGTAVWSARLGCETGLMLRPLYRGLPLALFPE